MNPSLGSNTGPGVCVKTRKPIRAENERQRRCEVRKKAARQALAAAQLPLGLCRPGHGVQVLREAGS